MHTQLSTEDHEERSIPGNPEADGDGSKTDRLKLIRSIPRWYFSWRWLALCAIGLFGAVVIASVHLALTGLGAPLQPDQNVSYVAFSPDSKYVLTGSNHGLARLWDSETGVILRTFGDSANGVDGVVFSPDGKYVLTDRGPYGAPLSLWDTATGAVLLTFHGGTFVVCSMAFSPDSKTILIVEEGGPASLWDTATGVVLRSFSGDHNTGCRAAYSPDNRSVLISNSDGTVSLWDVTTGAVSNTFANSGDEGFGLVAFSSNGRYVLIGNLEAKLLNVATGAAMCTFADSPTGVAHVAFSPDGKYVLIGSYSGAAKLWDLATCQFLHTIGDSPSPYGLAFSPDSKFVLTGSNEGSAKLWNLATGRVFRTFAYEVIVPPALLEYRLFMGTVQYGYLVGLALTMLSLISGVLINAWFIQRYDELRAVSWSRILRLPLLASAIAAVLFIIAMVLLFIANSVSGRL